MGFSRQEYWSGVPLPSPSAHEPLCNLTSLFLLSFLAELSSLWVSPYTCDIPGLLPACPLLLQPLCLEYPCAGVALAGSLSFKLKPKEASLTVSQVIGIPRGVTEENLMKAYFTEVWMDLWEPREKSDASGMSQMGDITDPWLGGARGGKNANNAWQELGPQVQELNHCPTSGPGWVRGGSWSVLTFASHSSISCECPPLARPNRENKEKTCLLLYSTEFSLLVYRAGERTGLQGTMENTTHSDHPTRLCPSFHLVRSPPFCVFIT